MIRSHLTADERDELDEREFREAEQAKLDDLAEAKRAASGISPESLSLMDAAAEGKKAGMWGHGPEMNPYRDEKLPEFKAWENARLFAIAYRLNGPALRRMP